MVKTKQRQLLAKKNRSRSNLIDSSISDIDLDLHGEDSWVMVKKQKVTILVPPLPVAIAKVSPTPDPEDSQLQLQTIPSNTVNRHAELPNETCLTMPSANDQEKALAINSQNIAHSSKKASPTQHFLTLAEPLKQDRIVESRMPDRFGMLRSSITSNFIKQPRVLYGPAHFLDGGSSLNQRLRAINLERKLQKAGGLSRWLLSLGLSQFVKIFQRKSINKFQLVNLTMKKLKDMGAIAVGPRRKLIHAIDCVCQPYCFESF